MTYSPFVLIPLLLSMDLKMFSLHKLKKSGDMTHPSLKIFCIWNLHFDNKKVWFHANGSLTQKKSLRLKVPLPESPHILSGLYINMGGYARTRVRLNHKHIISSFEVTIKKCGLMNCTLNKIRFDFNTDIGRSSTQIFNRKISIW